MDFEKTISEITNSIKQREFTNEAEVSNGIVMRILNELNWSVYDTKRVKPQYGIEGKKIDFALCYPDNKPIVIIEVKALGKAGNADEQVLIYSFKTGIPMAILTDGQEWHFYLPKERGSLTERRFYKLDLLERGMSEIIEIFKTYLDYHSVKDESAFSKAKTDYDRQYKRKEINDSIPTAWNKLLQDRDQTLTKLISEKVADLCGHEPTEETIFEFLNNLNKTKEIPNENISQPSKRQVEQDYQTPPTKGFRGVILNSTVYATRNAIGTLEALLNLTINLYPNCLNRIQDKTTGRARKLISKNKFDLYNNRPDLLEKSAKELEKGWWLGSNISGRQIEEYCKIIVDSITQEYGRQDIKWTH
jgi:hypothetical protein